MKSQRRAFRSVLSIALVCLGCPGQRVGSTDVTPRATALVPVIPPDSLPPDLADSKTWVSGESHFAGTILRDILILRFRPGTSQADRQAAVDLVGGSVVGGRRFSGDELYFVRVKTGGNVERLFEAIGALKALPQVSIVMPEEILFFDQRG